MQLGQPDPVSLLSHWDENLPIARSGTYGAWPDALHKLDCQGLPKTITATEPRINSSCTVDPRK